MVALFDLGIPEFNVLEEEKDMQVASWEIQKLNFDSRDTTHSLSVTPRIISAYGADSIMLDSWSLSITMTLGNGITPLRYLRGIPDQST